LCLFEWRAVLRSCGFSFVSGSVGRSWFTTKYITVNSPFDCLLSCDFCVVRIVWYLLHLYNVVLTFRLSCFMFGPGHSMAFAQQLSSVLTTHCDVLQQHKLQGYLRSVQQWLPRIEAFCDLKSAHPGHGTPAMAGTPGAPPTHSSAAEGGDEDRRRMSVKTSSARMSISGHGATTGGADASAQDRATLRRHTQLVKQIMALLQRNAVAVFSDCTKDLKPVLEICEITSGDTSVVVLSQISKFCNRLSQGMEALAGVANNRCTYDVATNQLTYVAGGEDADVIYGDGGGVGSAPVSPGGPSMKGPAPTAAASPPAEISAAPADSTGMVSCCLQWIGCATECPRGTEKTVFSGSRWSASHVI
jgi:hypothetical protein